MQDLVYCNIVILVKLLAFVGLNCNNLITSLSLCFQATRPWHIWLYVCMPHTVHVSHSVDSARDCSSVQFLTFLLHIY